MKDQTKTKGQLINELMELRQRASGLGKLKRQRGAEKAAEVSEDHLRLVTDFLPVLISYVDLEQRYRYNNKAYERWFGRPRTEVYGKHIKEVLGEPAYEVVRRNVETALSGKEVDFEGMVPYKNGGKRYVSANYVPHFGEQKKVKGIFVLVKDITKLKQAKKDLKESRGYLEELEEKPTAIVCDITEPNLADEALKGGEGGLSTLGQSLQSSSGWPLTTSRIGHLPPLIH